MINNNGPRVTISNRNRHYLDCQEVLMNDAVRIVSIFGVVAAIVAFIFIVFVPLVFKLSVMFQELIGI